MESDKGFLYGTAKHGIHGEAFSGPVHARSHPAQLRADSSSVLGLPCPNTFQELLSPKVMARELLLLVKQPLHNALGRDASVVCAGQPECHMSAHPMPTREGILDGAGERVTEMQGACDIGRRDHHDKPLGLHGVLGSFGVRGEETTLLPPSTPSRLDGLWVVGCSHGRCHVLFLALRSRHDENFLLNRSLSFHLGLLFGLA
mmetsp:Transcript_63182/g.137391  ORF Transcript_63182/g.137391 Transcript_63182/m.137391 type:complete len:202 (+) Transcript_63182:2473-3078(+)